MVLHLGGKFLSFLAWLRARRLLSDWMLVLKITNSQPTCYEFELSAAEDPPCRGGRMHFKSVEAQTSSHWCGQPLNTVEHHILEDFSSYNLRRLSSQKKCLRLFQFICDPVLYHIQDMINDKLTQGSRQTFREKSQVLHINYDEHGRHNTDKETTTQSSRLHDYREKSEESARFPEISVFIPDVEEHVTFL
ncbi:hypothetical protein TNCV_1335261 [Trichonephila clavipes]|nr:hypothetical protein TNCV_1335261 [Trichonephila clavipes]